MSDIVSVAGVVSGARVDTSISVHNTTTVTNHDTSSYAPSATTSSETIVNKNMCFRIDNRPANMKVAVNLTNGDLVTAAGLQKGELEVLAINNHTTRTMYWVPKPHILGHVVNVVTGVGAYAFGFHLISYALLGLGLWFLIPALNRRRQIAIACAIVTKAPAPSKP